MASPEFVVDFPTLGDLWSAWIERHCRVPDRHERGKPFREYDWQFWCTAKEGQVRPDAAFDPDAPPPDPRPRAHLLSTFDEAFLTYRDVPWPRSGGHPSGDAPYRWAESGGGPILLDLADAGSWRRTERPGRLTVRLDLAALSASGRREVALAARRVADALSAPGTQIDLEESPR